MWLFVPAAWADTVTCWAGSWLVSATLTTPTLAALTLSTSTTKLSAKHSFISFDCWIGAWDRIRPSHTPIQ